MLKTLRRIVQEVSVATNLDQALGIIVSQVRDAMGVNACSVYLADPEDRGLTLMATDGLRPESVGRVFLPHNKGLVGLVAERREPINFKDAASHPRYLYFPEKGEEEFHGFLGVPIIHYRKVVGVLVAQQQAERLFNDEEVDFLVTIAAQLAGAVNQALIGRGVTRLPVSRGSRESFIAGISGAPGVAIGTVVAPYPLARLESVPERACRDPAGEEAALHRAVAAVQQELRESGERMAPLLPAEEHALFDVYVMLLSSDSLVADTVRRIRDGQWAPGAWRDTILEHARVFERMEDEYLRARAEDIRDLGRRVLTRLQPEARTTLELPERCVLLGDDIGITQIAEIPSQRLAGVVCLKGSVLSHTAILARALGIPAVMGLGKYTMGQLDGCEIVVDGYQGRVYVQPPKAVREEYQRLIREDRQLNKGLEKLHDAPAATLDGVSVPLYVKAGLLADITSALRSGGDGIGLYRTEFAFMVRESFPSEDEQYRVYRRVLEAFAPRPVMMRTLDVGGDKELPYFPVREKNPFLGWRGVRLTLDHPEIFLTQIRAMLRADTGLGNLHMMFPMITIVDEVDEILSLVKRACRELAEEGYGAVRRPPVGIMLEVPAAIYQAAGLARRVDFLSLGTNDLTQYLLAVDRDNPQVSRLYDSLHPAVISAIQQAVEGSHRGGAPIGLCGEMASDPAAVILLLGMGIDNLSTSASTLPRIKWVIRSFTRRRARELLAAALELENAAAVRELLTEALEQAGVGGVIRPGK